jgi:hypothetical protein
MRCIQLPLFHNQTAKNMNAPTDVDTVILGTGHVQCVLAGALAKVRSHTRAHHSHTQTQTHNAATRTERDQTQTIARLTSRRRRLQTRHRPRDRARTHHIMCSHKKQSAAPHTCTTHTPTRQHRANVHQPNMHDHFRRHGVDARRRTTIRAIEREQITSCAATGSSRPRVHTCTTNTHTQSHTREPRSNVRKPNTHGTALIQHHVDARNTSPPTQHYQHTFYHINKHKHTHKQTHNHTHTTTHTT